MIASLSAAHAERLDVDVVVPVLDEEAVLEPSVRRLHRFLTDAFPFAWRIVIADNASTDRTPQIAAALAARLPGVEHVRLERRGRGRALRQTWLASPARVVCSMDVDVSTDLRALLPLVAPLLSGHSDVGIGTRLRHGAGSCAARGARSSRGPTTSSCTPSCTPASATLSAASRPCGPRRCRTSSAPSATTGGSSTTELLVLAQRRGPAIHELPVDWIDDPDSRVWIVPAAVRASGATSGSAPRSSC